MDSESGPQVKLKRRSSTQQQVTTTENELPSVRKSASKKGAIILAVVGVVIFVIVMSVMVLGMLVLNKFTNHYFDKQRLKIRQNDYTQAKQWLGELANELHSIMPPVPAPHDHSKHQQPHSEETLPHKPEPTKAPVKAVTFADEVKPEKKQKKYGKVQPKKERKYHKLKKLLEKRPLTFVKSDPESLNEIIDQNPKDQTFELYMKLFQMNENGKKMSLVMNRISFDQYFASIVVNAGFAKLDETAHNLTITDIEGAISLFDEYSQIQSPVGFNVGQQTVSSSTSESVFIPLEKVESSSDVHLSDTTRVTTTESVNEETTSSPISINLDDVPNTPEISSSPLVIIHPETPITSPEPSTVFVLEDVPTSPLAVIPEVDEHENLA